MRKVEPLGRALKSKQAWITGMRAEQAVTRANLPVQEFDQSNGLEKFNPLSDWTEQEIWLISAYMKCLTTSYTMRFIHRLAAPHARALLPWAKMSVRVAGGGKTLKTKSAGFMLNEAKTRNKPKNIAS